MASLFDAMFALLGKRGDDPAVLAFHAAHGLSAAPVLFVDDQLNPVEHPSDHYSVDYVAGLKRRGAYPPRREKGAYVSYVGGITLKPEFAGELADGVTTKLPYAEAKARAVEEMGNSFAKFVTLTRDDDREIVMVYKAKEPHGLREVRLQARELDDEDPRLAEWAAAMPQVKVRPRPKPGDVAAASNQDPPDALRRLLEVQADAGFGDDVDLELYDAWQEGGPEAWVGNADAERYFRVFGGDGSGGLLAFWLVEPRKALEHQPVVFLESEGKLGVVAKDLGDFLVLLANGVGPYEVIAYGSSSGTANDAVRSIADSCAAVPKGRTPVDVLREANVAYPDFGAWVMDLRLG